MTISSRRCGRRRASRRHGQRSVVSAMISPTIGRIARRAGDDLLDGGAGDDLLAAGDGGGIPCLAVPASMTLFGDFTERHLDRWRWMRTLRRRGGADRCVAVLQGDDVIFGEPTTISSWLGQSVATISWMAGSGDDELQGGAGSRHAVRRHRRRSALWCKTMTIRLFGDDGADELQAGLGMTSSRRCRRRCVLRDGR